MNTRNIAKALHCRHITNSERCFNVDITLQRCPLDIEAMSCGGWKYHKSIKLGSLFDRVDREKEAIKAIYTGTGTCIFGE